MIEWWWRVGASYTAHPLPRSPTGPTLGRPLPSVSNAEFPQPLGEV